MAAQEEDAPGRPLTSRSVRFCADAGAQATPEGRLDPAPARGDQLVRWIAMAALGAPLREVGGLPEVAIVGAAPRSAGAGA